MITWEMQMEIVVLSKKEKKSISAISRELGLNWRTVSKYLRHEGQRKPYDTSKRRSKLAPFYEHIHRWIDEDEYTATWMYHRLKQMGYRGSYDQVKRYVRPLREQRRRTAYVRFETEPGRQAQVDFADLQIRDEAGRVVETVYLFSMVLGYSRAAYYEVVPRRDLTQLLACHVHAFDYFGGVPAEIVYDRMKQVVVRRDAGGTDWNPRFMSLCRHYGYKPLLTPAYAPWVKGKVERPFRYVREQFWRGYPYRDCGSATRDLQAWAAEDMRRVHRTTGERIDERFAREQPSLGALPPVPFDSATKVYRTVRKDCTISVEGNRYVLPHRCVGRLVVCKVQDGVLSAYLDNDVVSVYDIPDGRGHCVQESGRYEALRADEEQCRRKYGRRLRVKGAARCAQGGGYDGLTVAVRSMREYEEASEV